jgi:hypothetical protein
LFDKTLNRKGVPKNIFEMNKGTITLNCKIKRGFGNSIFSSYERFARMTRGANFNAAKIVKRKKGIMIQGEDLVSCLMTQQQVDKNNL